MDVLDATRPVLKQNLDGAYHQFGYEHITGDYSDPRIFLATPWHPEVACGTSDMESACGLFQACDGPAYLVLGPFAPDEKLQRVSNKYGIPFDDLIEFRDTMDGPNLPVWQPIAHVQTESAGIKSARDGEGA